MFSLKFTSVLTIVLAISLILRIIGIEPFPAILLPSGPKTLNKIDGKVYLPCKMLQAKDKTGNWREVDPLLLMHPIPTHAFFPIMKLNFGFINEDELLNRRRYKLLKMLHLNHNIGLGKLKDHEVQYLGNWFKKKLSQQGLMASEIRITTYTLTISASTDLILKKTFNSEKTILLDKYFK